MKKLLSIMTAVGLMATTSISVVSCGTPEKNIPNIDDGPNGGNNGGNEDKKIDINKVMELELGDVKYKYATEKPDVDDTTEIGHAQIVGWFNGMLSQQTLEIIKSFSKLNDDGANVQNNVLEAAKEALSYYINNITSAELSKVADDNKDYSKTFEQLNEIKVVLSDLPQEQQTNFGKYFTNDTFTIKFTITKSN